MWLIRCTLAIQPVKNFCLIPKQASRACSTLTQKASKSVEILGESYVADSWTNVSPRVLSKIGVNLHNKPNSPLFLIRQQIQNYFYSKYVNRRGNPLFAVFDNINPVVTTEQNFDSLLVPEDHVSRSSSDTYYVNKSLLLRAHTSAHQEELIKMGFDNFLVVGDVYRRDAIDASHYPVFHQMEGVRLFTETELFSKATDTTDLSLFEAGRARSMDKQETHTMEAAKLVEHDLKTALMGLAQRLFGAELEYRWVDAYFPFTHPSWELEVRWGDDWLEVLGCGVVEQQILEKAGAGGKIGWAFGLGLERLAMKLYGLPDIRLFWSDHPAFLQQFTVDNPETPITYKAVSQYPACTADLSMWLPSASSTYSPNDFYDLVRSVGGDLVERVDLVDEFTQPRTARTSHCYRLTYRHMEKTLTQPEVNALHAEIAAAAVTRFGAEIR